jgi:ribonuclease D
MITSRSLLMKGHDVKMFKLIRSWVNRLVKIPSVHAPILPEPLPTREEIARLSPFQALNLDKIVEVTTPEAAWRAYHDLAFASVVGFDTESRPTFRAGQVSSGPHVVQFATTDRAYVFMIHEPECLQIAGELIALRKLKKVGFGLRDDLVRVRSKMGVEPRNMLDLETMFSEKGLGKGIGVKVGIALTLKRRFMKSKKTQTSNWGCSRLTEIQLLYAANDAYAAIRVYHALASSGTVSGQTRRSQP